MITLETELLKIRGLGQNFLNRLAKLKIQTVRDLLWHFPARYDDFSAVAKIADLQVNQSATIFGVVKKIETRRAWRRKMMIVEAFIADETGVIKAIWFNQPYVGQILRLGSRVNLAGKVSLSGGEIQLSSPAYEISHDAVGFRHTAGLIPIYPETRGLTSRGIRYLIKPILHVLPELPEWIPEDILKVTHLPSLSLALQKIHFPATLRDAEDARRRFAFEDLFLLQLNNLRLKSQLAKERATSLVAEPERLERVVGALPFILTGSQKRSLDEILSDVSKPHPMNRLLQGDVGSGKTVVAAFAALVAAFLGTQASFMAPTEILARQHYRTFQKIFKSVLAEEKVSVGLLTGAEARIFYGEGLESKISKADFLRAIASGELAIIIGTHALIEASVVFHNLTLTIIDEQHRFGVKQRAALVSSETKVTAGLKKSENREKSLPHFLSMSATPIPRTLSLTLFGDLDVSIIEELPKGRKPVVTKVVSPENRDKAYAFVREEIKKGRQVFVICPRIEIAEATQSDEGPAEGGLLPKPWNEVKAVKAEYERLSKKVFPEFTMSMLHGKLKSKEKEKVMTAFSQGEVQILVATSVVEVGVDVPNATSMIIEGADRFGLAQLYQFRGRIGRGEHQSYCFLFTDSESQSVEERLRALVAAKNGFELAEQDLALRGPGEFLGDKQTGLPDVAMRSLNNAQLIKTARDAAVGTLTRDPELKHHPLLRERLDLFEKQIHLE